MAGEVNTTRTMRDEDLELSYNTTAGVTWAEANMSHDHFHVEVDHQQPSLVDELHLIDIFLLTHSFMFVATSILFNSCVLYSMIHIPMKTLKCKAAIINFLLVDIIFPSGYGILLLLDIIMLFGIRHPCLTSSKVLILPLVQYVHTFAQLSVALDRLYAVVMPLHYKIQSTLTLALISILPSWGIPLILTLPSFMAAVSSNRMSGYCQRLAVNNSLQVWRLPLVVALKILILCIYAFVFTFIRWARKSLEVASSRVTSIKCAIAFFAIHVLGLTLYLPGPLFAILSASGIMGLEKMTISRVRRVLISLYLLGPTADPVIMVSKIPPLKSKILHVWRQRGPSKSQTEDITKSTSANS